MVIFTVYWSIDHLLHLSLGARSFFQLFKQNKIWIHVHQVFLRFHAIFLKWTKQKMCIKRWMRWMWVEKKGKNEGWVWSWDFGSCQLVSVPVTQSSTSSIMQLSKRGKLTVQGFCTVNMFITAVYGGWLSSAASLQWPFKEVQFYCTDENPPDDCQPKANGRRPLRIHS